MTRLSFSFLVPLSVAAAALTLTACDVSVGTGFDGSDTDGGLWQDDGKVTGGGFDPRGADLKLKTGGPWLI
ncbi:MAG: hypothetical protein KC416_14720, partial [Myxococcales bacterium]|nr:hypothetical protein [Myxococcales bacterium]